MDIDIGLLASFGAGLISFLSPCILPLVPPYLCFLAGTSLRELTADRTAAKTAPVVRFRSSSALAARQLRTSESKDHQQLNDSGAPFEPEVRGRICRTVCANFGFGAPVRALAFVIGFTCVFVALGASASTFGRLVSDHLALLSRIAGIIIVVLGLHMVGIFRIPLLMRQARFETVGPPASMAGAFAVGLAFGFGWTPCVGPVLASILLLAGTEATVGRGAALLVAYAAGIGVPFVAASLFTGPFLRLAARFRAHLSSVEKAMGAVLVATGLLVFAGAMPEIGGWLLEYVPILGRIG